MEKRIAAGYIMLEYNSLIGVGMTDPYEFLVYNAALGSSYIIVSMWLHQKQNKKTITKTLPSFFWKPDKRLVLGKRSQVDL